MIYDNSKVLKNNSNGNEYLIGKALGQGGFGVVYIAWDIKNNRRVAIKEYFPFVSIVTRTSSNTLMLNPETPANREFFDKQKLRFHQEAEKMMQFKASPNIVNVFEVFNANNTAYIVMEFIEGHTFLKILSGRDPQPLDVVLYNLKPIIDVLEVIHNTPYVDSQGISHKGMIHRDISPDNIMFAGNGTVKLLDFGAARAAGDSATRILKPGYAPYEQCLSVGKEAIQDSYTDIYALAATIYKAITGKIPPESINRYSNDTLEPPSKLGAQITPWQEKALLKGLAIKYVDRYQSVSDFYKDLTTPPPEPAPGLISQLSNTLSNFRQGFFSNANPSPSMGSNTRNRVAGVFAVICVLVSMFFFSDMNAKNRSLREVKNELANTQKHLEKYSDFQKYYGGSPSNSYYAEKAVLFMKKNSSEKLLVHCDLPEGVKAFFDIVDGANLIGHDDSLYNSETHNAVIPINSKNTSGYATIRFGNSGDDKTFDVLIIIQ